MRLTLTSFGYKFGLPADADIVLDVRFLPNPFYVPDLSPLSGLDGRVKEYIEREESARVFLAKTEDWLEFVISKFAGENKPRITIAIGCTGGRHRSVAVAERIREFLEEKFSRRNTVKVSTVHRDIERES